MEIKNNIITWFCNWSYSGNILISYDTDLYGNASITDLGLCILENDLILKSDNKSNNIYGSIPYIPPEVLRGN